jgi:hypothetical protein
MKMLNTIMLLIICAVPFVLILCLCIKAKTMTTEKRIEAFIGSYKVICHIHGLMFSSEGRPVFIYPCMKKNVITEIPAKGAYILGMELYTPALISAVKSAVQQMARALELFGGGLSWK